MIYVQRACDLLGVAVEVNFCEPYLIGTNIIFGVQHVYVVERVKGENSTSHEMDTDYVN